MRIFVYIDGFNLYYGALKGSPYRWLNLVALAERLFPRDNIARVHYFTSRIRPRGEDPRQAQRQQAYLRALRALPKIEVHLGTFIGDAPREKGSDVNLATELLVDAAKDRFEVAVVISNDSDLATAVRAARDDFGARICVINPQLKQHMSTDLLETATFVKSLSKQMLADSQLPDKLHDDVGTVTKPPQWR